MNNADLKQRILAHLVEGDAIQSHLIDAGPRLIERMHQTESIRKIGGRVGLSSAYLCSVLNGNSIISKGAFVRLFRCDAQPKKDDCKQEKDQGNENE